MNDRELLELAAKAAGIDLHWSKSGIPEIYDEDYQGRFPWIPMDDDGDALRLAVILQMNVCVFEEYTCASTGLIEFDEDAGNDICAATRRAIVRAAAEIGKAMP